MDQPDKNIDQAWKETTDLSFFITTLAMQASIFMGYIENPQSNKKEENLPQAKFIIDTLAMLKEKTKGNLTQEEDKILEDVLYELRMGYISLNQKEKRND